MLARRWLGVDKVGHTGTLDPFASGLLLLCLGPATRLAQYLPTDDLQGEPLSASEGWKSLGSDEVRAALAAFEGKIEQRPPDFSAKKVQGKRAYERARKGAEVALAAATVRIHWIRLDALDLPYARFSLSCSTGTYVRAIARDLGERLGVGGHLTGLRRTLVGPFDVRSALPLATLADAAAAGRALVSPLDALRHLPRLSVTAEEASLLRRGQPVRAGAAGDARAEGEHAVALGSELVAVAALDGEWLRPRKVFSTEEPVG
jgi:tRNA pseudouridine55 synthase